MNLEPLYTLKVAAEVIPFTSVNTLSQFLFKHKGLFPPRYRKYRHFAVRLLTEGEIKKIREMTVINGREYYDKRSALILEKYGRLGRPPKNWKKDWEDAFAS